jgi:hypothetical protein
MLFCRHVLHVQLQFKSTALKIDSTMMFLSPRYCLPHFCHVCSKRNFKTSTIQMDAAVIADATAIGISKHKSKNFFFTDHNSKRCVSTSNKLRSKHNLRQGELSSSVVTNSTDHKYLHISPSGDFWFGTSLFAAVRDCIHGG